ncbi:MAG: type IV secretory system conjugative DNA transfer family protein [Lachnospiraceae bacterium]|nr:type IV secretory system conjugative DNA transfer family protein [Lachnospiraceae bacterium]
MDRMNGTRFLTQDELAKTLTEIDINANTYPVGGIPMLVSGDKLYIDAEDSHTMIFGATGSKKTRMFAMPSIGIFARAGESFVVTDPKGELYDRTIGDVVSYGYQGSCVNLRDFRAGVTWNPLSLPYRYYHNGKKTKAIEFAIEMSKMIIGEDSTEETFWSNTAVDVFSGFILLLFEKASEGECHIKGLADLWKSYISERRRTIAKIKDEFGGSIVYQKISSLDNPSEKTVGSIEAFISMGLNKLGINEEFIDFLSQKGLDLQELAGKKNAIYLVIPDENKSYHFIASLFLEQLYEVLIEKAQSEPAHKLPVRMNFLIDEFANIPKIGNMEAMITAARSRNIRFHLIVQGMKQLEQKYAEGAETIMGNCNNWIYLYSKEYNLLQEISRLCGEVIYDNNVRMPLFSEFDLQHLNKEKGEALVLAGRNCPCLTQLADIDDYPYPILPPQELVKPQRWKKIRSFWDKDGEKDHYFCEIDPEDDPYKRRNLKPEKTGEGLQCRAAVGPGGMILATEVFDKSMIDSKAAIALMASRELAKLDVEPEYAEWYIMLPMVKASYDRRMEVDPEVVFMTLEELGAERFRKIMDSGNAQGYLPKVQESEMILYFTKSAEEILCFTHDLEELDKNVKVLGSLDAYDGKLGTRYLLNHAFRKANQELENTDFEDVSWHYENKKYNWLESAIYTFTKQNDKGEFAVLQIIDNRSCLNPKGYVPTLVKRK